MRARLGTSEAKTDTKATSNNAKCEAFYSVPRLDCGSDAKNGATNINSFENDCIALGMFWPIVACLETCFSVCTSTQYNLCSII